MKLSPRSKLKVQGGIVQSAHIAGMKTSMLSEHSRTNGSEKGNKKGVPLQEQDATSTSTASVIFCSSEKRGKRDLIQYQPILLTCLKFKYS